MPLTPPAPETPDEQADLRTLTELCTVLVQLDAIDVTISFARPYKKEQLPKAMIYMLSGLSVSFLTICAVSWNDDQFGLKLLIWGLSMIIFTLILLMIFSGKTHLRLTSQHLQAARQQLPLEDIQGVKYIYSIASGSTWGVLELTLPDRVVDLSVPHTGAGPALERLIRQHVERRRLALAAEGHDVSQKARPPAALLDLQRQRRS